MNNIKELVQQLELFSRELIELQEPIVEKKIVDFEKRFGLELPKDYKVLLRLHNGLSLVGTTVYGIDNGLYSIEKSYVFEHDEVDNPMPGHLVPFSPDGGGNHFCFNINKCDLESCEIMFWQHDLIYSDDDIPEVVNASFGDWIKEVLIDWTLEDYDYSGKKQL